MAGLGHGLPGAACALDEGLAAQRPSVSTRRPPEWRFNGKCHHSSVTPGRGDGDLEASPDLDDADDPKYVLSKAKIAGSVTKGAWTIAGAVGSILSGLDSCADLDALSVKAVSVKGDLDGATVNLTQAVDPKLKALSKLIVEGWTRETAITSAGHVAAWCITKANVREVVTDNAGDPFGFAWCELKSLTWLDGGDKFKWPEKKPADWPDDTGDFGLRVLA